MPHQIATPCIAWVNAETRDRLENYASERHDSTERAAGRLLASALAQTADDDAGPVERKSAPAAHKRRLPALDAPVEDDSDWHERRTRSVSMKPDRNAPPEASPMAGRDTRTEAEAFLLDLLANGRCAAGEVRERARSANLPWSAVEEVAKRLGVKRRKIGAHSWWWTLPE